MKLYFKPGACSLASHIVLNEIGSSFDIEAVDTAKGKTASGADYNTINPLGYVPALEIDPENTLVEGAAILQYLADQNPTHALAPQNGTLERAKLQQHLNFISAELHKAFGLFFSGRELTASEREAGTSRVHEKLGYFENILSDGRTFLLGDTFSVADAYLFVVTSWTGFVNIDISGFPKLKAFLGQVASRPAVQASMKAEGLLN
ncbi:glutathione transferase GstA [Sneathiella sp.]|jgi:glutathione S-transferase|uniref:glutathione transferase GstA n=1 Tax=Sneathiella sp. TaxID=1964365 RepID=UPI0039E37085